jgi:hypothetical protein
VEGITLNESDMLGVHAKVLALMSEPFLKRAVLDVGRFSRASVTAFAIVAATGNIYAGLMYPIIVAAMTFILGVLFIQETRGRDIVN